MIEGYYTAPEVAARLGLSTSRVRELAAARGVGRRVGARVLLFSAADVEALRERRPGWPKGRPRPSRIPPPPIGD